MLRIKNQSQRIDTAFVVALFALFAITAFVLVIIGVTQYKETTNSMTQNYQTRTASSYLEEKARQYDSGYGISVEDFNGVEAITLREKIDDVIFTTYIYYLDGSLKELLVTEESVVTPDAGQDVMAIKNMQLELVSQRIVKATIIDETGSKTTVYLGTRAD